MRLDEMDSAISNGMPFRGNHQDNIAAWIGEISASAKYAYVAPADMAGLPPHGP